MTTETQNSDSSKKAPTGWERFKFYLKHAHAIWLVPICIAGFYFTGTVLQALFGVGVGTYDIGFWQPLLLAAGVVSFAVNIAIMILYFSLHGLYEFFFGYKKDNGVWENPSKADWEALPHSWRFAIAFFVFLFFVAAILVVFLKLI